MHAGQPCELCLENPISATRVHPYGVRLCESCARGLMPDLLGLRGLQISSEIQFDQDDESRIATHIVHARLPGISGSFSFARRGALRKLLELVTRPRRVGDPIFDDHITASGEPAAALARALSSDGMQSAVLEMASAASFTVRGGELDWVCVRSAPDEILVRDTRRNAAIVLHHLQNAALG